MSRTRRRAAAEAEKSSTPTPGPSQVDRNPDVLIVSIPDELDQQHLAEILPEIPDLEQVTPDVVAFLYELVAKQYALLDQSQRELDDFKAENERKDVELEQAFLEKESLSKDLENSVASVQEELAKANQARAKLAEDNATLNVQLSTLSESQSASSSEVEALRHQVEEIEREKRDLLSVISRSKQDEFQRDEEVLSLRNTLKEARQEHQQLESQIRELRSAETSTKFKLDTLTQQLQLAQTESERSNAELTTKAEEYAKYRRTKHAEIVALQSSFDSLTQEHTVTQASLKALQSTHSAQTNQLTQALSKIQALTGQIAEQEARYASEANGLKRLIQMMEEREKQAKEIVENIEGQWATVGQKAEERENSLKDKLEHEARRREEAEKRVDQLETLLHQMGRGELPVPGTSMLSTPGTPGAGEFDGMLGLSPTVALASKSQRKGKTFTEVYAEFVKLQQDHAQKCLEHDQMDRTLSAVLAEIEERAPLLSQQRTEYERVKVEASELSAQLAQALSERDSQAKLAEENGQKLKKATAESNLLQQQLNDLGHQIQYLLREIARHDDPTIPPDADLQNVPVINADNVNELITNNLVLFRNIEGLQAQNQKLLGIVRDMGEKMESEERDYKEVMQQEQAEAIQEAHEAMQDLASQLEQQKKHSESVIQAYVKERDALKSMLARAQAAASRAGVSIDVTQQQPSGETQIVAPLSDSQVAKELVEVQQQFEAYKTEMGVDSTKLREELLNAQRELHELHTSLAKANAKVDYLNERQRVHSDEYQLTHRQLDEMAKRNQTLFDQWTRTDIECGRLSEDLHVANGRLEQLRNECANLRAEKQIWDGVQARLMDENKTLALERSHLSDIISNVQKMHNDLERTGEVNSRRLENQIKMLEGQVQDLRTQLARERESVRHIGLQKDLETKDLQSRLDKANLDLSKTREGLISAETSKQHLEQRVADLTKQLQGLEEKITVYEHRPSSTALSVHAANPDLSREQQLEQEVAELRSALKVAEVDLASARGHVEQFKEISQANEVALSSLNSTFDEYKASTEAQISRHESEYKTLEGKLEAASKELAEIREQHATAQKLWEEERTALKSDKKTLEETIIDMSTSEKHLETDRSSREQEVRALENRAKSAEERYSHEIVAHAESIKLIETLRRDLLTSQDKVRDHQTAADTAVAKLAASEESWNKQKEILDKEIADLNARCRDLASQNSLLHQHLESVSSQAAKIRQTATESGVSPSADGEATEDADTKLSELRSLVTYLRREKEIVDLQLDVTKQENTRLKNRVDDLSQSLQEARNTLSEERERAVQTAASASQHAELVERINQLNILRESNAMLRAESESHAKKARDLEAKLERLSKELEPAKEQARLAQAELEAARGQLQRLEQESQGWQERNKQLLSKYDRVDPAEIQALKDEVEQLRKFKAEFEPANASHEKELAAKQAELETQTKVYETEKQRFLSFQSNTRTQLRTMNERHAALTKENAELQTKLAAAQADTTPAAATPSPTAIEELKKKDAALAALQAEHDKLLAEKEALVKVVPPAVAAPAPSGWAAEKTALVKARDDALQKVKECEEQIQKVNNELRSVRMQNEKFHSRLEAMAKARAGEQERVEAAIAKSRSEDAASGDNAAVIQELEKKHIEALENMQKELQTKYEADLKAALEEASKQEPVSGDQKAAIEAALAAQKQELEAERTKAIEEAVEQGMERGRQEMNSKIRVKDGQLSRAQARNKQLEAMIGEWEKTGVVPPGSIANAPPLATTTVSPVQGGPKPAVPPVSGSKAATAPAAPAPSAPATTSKAAAPPTATARGAAPPAGAASGGVPATARGGAPTTRGGAVATKGVAPAATKGGAAARGGQRGGVPLGVRNPPSRPLPSKQATPTGGLSIAGAAAAAAASTSTTPNTKRPREESDGPAQDESSLAKRLKPADSAATTPAPAAGGAKVPLRRPPPGS